MKSKDNSDLLQFKSNKLTSNARCYQKELLQLTFELLEVNRRVEKSLWNCKSILELLKDPDKNGHIIKIDEDFLHFYDLTYHLENYISRIHAYRDKYCMFLNFVFKLGYSEKEMNLLNKIIKHKEIIDANLHTELNKFKRGVLSELISKRKNFSHIRYYSRDDYLPLLMPKNSPKDIGFKKASDEWKKNIISEADKINKITVDILKLNKRTVEKIIKAL
jgi:hypothetical protein